MSQEETEQEKLERLRDLVEHMVMEIVEFDYEVEVSVTMDRNRKMPSISIVIAKEDHTIIHELIRSVRFITRAAAKRCGYGMVDIYFQSIHRKAETHRT